MHQEELRSKLNQVMREDSFDVFGDPRPFVIDPFCSKCEILLKDDEQIKCRRCARIRINK